MNGRPDDQAHEVEHEHDVVDDAERFDDPALFGPPTEVEPLSVELCPICRRVVMTVRERVEQHACDRCYASAFVDGMTERRRRR